MKIIESIDRVFITIGMICLFFIMVIVAFDGLGRQFFDKPIVGAYELVEKYLMTAMIFPVIGYTWAKKGHIGVTIFYEKMPKAIQNIAYLITIIAGLIIFGIIGYTGYDTTYTSYTGNQLTSGLIRWPLWVAYIWMPLGSAIFCVRLIVEFFQSIILIRKNGLNNILLNVGSSHESAD
jgi:TRAP-type transport system small permease protein